jgi:hypothetical protein
MKRSDISLMPDYFDKYINLADDIDVRAALRLSLTELENPPMEQWIALGNLVYAPEKWTLRDILQHLIDTERVFTYRALTMARKDFEKKPYFLEDEFGAHAQANRRTIADLLAELKIVRQSTIALFESFPEGVLSDTTTTFSKGYTVLCVGFILAGHQRHHWNLLEEKYYPLITK